MGIIRSVLDQDSYSLSMRKAIAQNYPGVPVRYQFINRRPVDTFDDETVDAIVTEVEAMADLRLSDEEACWLNTRCPELGEQSIVSLGVYRFDPSQVNIDLDDGGKLTLSVDGPWESAKLWEVPLLAIVTELWCRRQDELEPLVDGWEDRANFRIRDKATQLSGSNVRWSDFGTRRRRSFEAQDSVVRIMACYAGFQGTSNLFLAMQHGVKPIGTMAHEFIMGVSVLEGMRHANRHALRKWADTFHGELGIALTDTFGTYAFWGDFDGYLARLYDGVRHDSGDPIAFGERAIEEYRKRGIDPCSKVIVFSDGLDVPKVLDLQSRFSFRIGTRFGIGTSLTNDVEGRRAPNFVIKMVECDGVPTVKLSDDPGKATGDPEALRNARWVFGGTS